MFEYDEYKKIKMYIFWLFFDASGFTGLKDKTWHYKPGSKNTFI